LTDPGGLLAPKKKGWELSVVGQEIDQKKVLRKQVAWFSQKEQELVIVNR
jgi:uncharacterized protein YhdP